MSIRLTLVLLCGLTELAAAQGSREPATPREVGPLVAVVNALRQRHNGAGAVQFAEVRHAEALTSGGPLPHSTARTGPVQRHSDRTLRLLRDAAGLATVPSVEQAPRKCSRDLSMRDTSAVICELRDASAVYTVGTPTYVGDTAVVVVAITSNRGFNTGVGKVVVEVKAVPEKRGWRTLAPKILWAID